MNNRTFLYIIVIMCILAASACVRVGQVSTGEFTEELYAPSHAGGFRLLRIPGRESTLIEVGNPWQGADSVCRYLFISRNGEMPPRGVTAISGTADRIVCMSTSHIGMLDAIGATDAVVGVSGMDYVTSPALKARRQHIADVGYEGAMDYERLMAARPDLVLIYGVNGPSVMEEKLSELGIPALYVGDYLEQDPLGRAEWAVALGELTGLREEAIARFESVVAAYDSIRTSCAGAVNAPAVMLNAPYSDTWFMPPVQSYMVRLINHASGRYLYSENDSGISRPIDMEMATLLLDKADVWLQPGQARTLEQAQAAAPKARFHCQVFNSIPDFWESGAARPDLVLADMSAILHGTPADSVLRYFIHLK